MRMRNKWVLLVVAGWFAAIGLSGGPYQRDAPPAWDCPPEGRGGDPALNRQKNREVAPKKYRPVDLPSLLAELPIGLPTLGPRADYPDAVTAQLARWESQGVALEGYVIGFKREGPESPNCLSKIYRDHHIWIGAHPGAPKSDCLVVEITPRTETAALLRTLAVVKKQRQKVIVKGWLMYDPHHAAEVGRSRASDWEVHPVFTIAPVTKSRVR